MQYAVRCAWFLPVLVLLVGCTDSSMSRVRGKVTLDGEPIEEGTISFYPVGGKGQTTGGDIKNGAYSVEVAVGKVQVRISKAKIVGQKKLYNTPNSPTRPLTAEALPEKYNVKSQLEVDVVPGGVEKDWALTSK
jgi:hypothetical protein